MRKTFFLIAAILCTQWLGAQWTTSGTNIYNSNTGFVGIGSTNAPTTPLEVRRDQTSATIAKVRNLATGAGAIARFELGTYTTNAWHYSSLVQNNGTPYYQFSVGSAVTNVYFDGPQFAWRNTAGTTTWLTLTTAGSVGIGTATTGSFKLAVEGTIGTRAIKITSTSPWPDYVFKPNYKLPSLKEIESYIQQYQHLPGMPSAQEIQQSEGVDLGEMNRKLLEKVEELTLHIIELNKRIEQLEGKEKAKD